MFFGKDSQAERLSCGGFRHKVLIYKDSLKGIDTFGGEMRRFTVIHLLLLTCSLWAQEPRFVNYSWAATRSGLWSPSGKHFLDGILVQSVEADSAGRLWAGTEDGLYFIDTDGSVGRVPKELGFPSDIYGEHVSCTLRDGSLSFGGASGAIVFHPDSLLGIKAAGTLPLEVLVRHRYRLNGGDWNEGRFIGLTDNIRPGRYSLEEQSSDIFGRWNQGESVLQLLRVPPPIWLRWPFLLGYLLLLSAIVYTVMKLRERRLLVKELDMRNRLFFIISHDIRGPVSGNYILSRELLEKVDGLSRVQLKEALAELSASAENASSLLENLLLWSLSQKGMLKPVMREVNLLDVAKEAVGSVRGQDVITVDIPENLIVRTDRNMLLTILRNLLDNAVKASQHSDIPGAPVILRSEATKDLLHARQIVIIDNGLGLREEAPEWGHGLGLVIARELLDKLSAGMEMKNRPEGGLQTTIDL